MSSNTSYQYLFRDKVGKLHTTGKVASGVLTGVTEATVVVTPFEVVKIKLQQQKIVPGQAPKYQGPLHTARTVFMEEGLLGLWAGWLPTVLRNGTNQMCLFTMKHFLDELFWDKKDGDGKRLEFWQAGLSAMGAATVGPVATGPFDVAKTRLMAQESVNGVVKYKNLLDVLVKVPKYVTTLYVFTHMNHVSHLDVIAVQRGGYCSSMERLGTAAPSYSAWTGHHMGSG